MWRTYQRWHGKSERLIIDWLTIQNEIRRKCYVESPMCLRSYLWEILLTREISNGLHGVQTRQTTTVKFPSFNLHWLNSGWQQNHSKWTSAHWGRVTHICVSKLCHIWFRWWLVYVLVPSNYPSQCCIIVSWTLGNKLQLTLSQNKTIFILEIGFRNIAWYIAQSLYRYQNITTNFIVFILLAIHLSWVVCQTCVPQISSIFFW